MISHIGLSIAGKTVLILGSGGTSKTALAVVEELGCTQAVRVSRAVKSGCVTYEQAKEVAESVAGKGVRSVGIRQILFHVFTVDGQPSRPALRLKPLIVRADGKGV